MKDQKAEVKKKIKHLREKASKKTANEKKYLREAEFNKKVLEAIREEIKIKTE